MITTNHLLAAAMNWPNAIVVIVLISAIAFISSAALTASKGTPMIGPRRLDAIDDDLAAIRADLAELKESIAELDRLFKSVG
jgi:hypothetical protein